MCLSLSTFSSGSIIFTKAVLCWTLGCPWIPVSSGGQCLILDVVQPLVLSSLVWMKFLSLSHFFVILMFELCVILYVCVTSIQVSLVEMRWCEVLLVTPKVACVILDPL